MGKKNPILSQFKSACAICRKDMFIYYLKAPVLIYGLLFPFFLFLAFAIGRDISFESLLPTVLGLSIFFTSSSVGPIIAPWETRMRTLEKLISCPISLEFILLGDILAGFLYGMAVTLILLIFFIPFSVFVMENLFILILGIILSNFCFSCLGILLSSPATDNPSNIMMLSYLVKFPLIFISGVFLPINKLPPLGRLIAKFSPLTYTVDLLRYSSGKDHIYPAAFCLIVLFISIAVFLCIGIFLHRRNLPKRF